MNWVKPLMAETAKSDLAWMAWKEAWNRCRENNNPWCMLCKEKDCSVDGEKCEMIRVYLSLKAISLIVPKSFSEWYAFCGGEELGINREKAERIWLAGAEYGKNINEGV